jgi:hypothetical protein
VSLDLSGASCALQCQKVRFMGVLNFFACPWCSNVALILSEWWSELLRCFCWSSPCWKSEQVQNIISSNFVRWNSGLLVDPIHCQERLAFLNCCLKNAHFKQLFLAKIGFDLQLLPTSDFFGVCFCTSAADSTTSRRACEKSATLESMFPGSSISCLN